MKFQEISISDFKSARQSQPDLFLVDVREEYEFEDFNIGGINIPMSEVLSRTAEFDNKVEVYLFCASGKRSKTVAYHLSQTIENTIFYSICGGTKEYIAEES
jgi:rhodanese-related sulfurtransferase